MTTISPSPADVPTGFDPFAGYAAKCSGPDEAISEGVLKDYWQPFAAAVATMPTLERIERQSRLRRLVQENGIAHDLFADAGGRQPWSVDLTPIILSAEDWQHLEKGLIQRARLLDAVAKDIYGQQNLLRNGAIPPRLIFSDSTFLHACRGIAHSGNLIDFFAADLVRDTAGAWRIADMHTETPAGIGFALANRLVHGQVMGDVSRACGTVRLAPHFQDLQTDLLQRAGRDDPLIVLLAPGPRHEDYFSHAYLSRYLGFQLVEGGDLRVAGSRVYMKTLEGLKPIDLLIRCVEGSRCDPLELDPDGFAGPAGFVQALRKNPQLVTNALGASILQNRGLAPYLPKACQTLLGQDLELLDTPRRWLGDLEARLFVFGHRDRFVIRRAQEGTGRPGRAEQGVVLEQLPGRELDALKFELEANGQDYVAEERTAISTAPSWTAAGLEPRPFAMRMYVMAVEGEYRVMPGGLAMSLDAPHGTAMSASTGHSRDVWVTSKKEMSSQLTLLRPPGEIAHILRAGKGLRSRIADNLYWLGRYTERADWILRIARRAMDEAEEGSFELKSAVSRKALLILVSKDTPKSGVAAIGAEFPVTALTRIVLADRERSYSVPGVTGNMLRVGSIVRDRLSFELWRTLLRFSRQGSSYAHTDAPLSDSADWIADAMATLASYNGLTAENMTRNFGWRFQDIGRRLERAYNLAELLQTLFCIQTPESEEATALFFALDVADSTITFRQRYLFAPILPLVLDLLAADETNPRGIGFQLAAVSDHLSQLPQSSEYGNHNEERRLILDLLTKLRLAQVSDLAHVEGDGRRTGLQHLLDALIAGLPKLSDAITRRYFTLTDDDLRRVSARPGSRA